MSQINAAEIHKTLQEMAAHIAGEHNYRGQLLAMGAILGDQKLYAELVRRTAARTKGEDSPGSGTT